MLKLELLKVPRQTREQSKITKFPRFKASATPNKSLFPVLKESLEPVTHSFVCMYDDIYTCLC